jgi:hypothetical protein
MITNADQKLAGMDEAVILQALDEARARISRAEHDRAELDRVLAGAREEEQLLARLLALRRGATPANAEAGSAGPEHQTNTAEQTRIGATDADSKNPAVQAVVQELAAAGRPLHISDLMRLLRDRQVQIPGAGTQANLITHLRRDPRLVRPSRGMYGLSAWGLENMPATTHRKRRKRRGRSTASPARTET